MLLSRKSEESSMKTIAILSCLLLSCSGALAGSISVTTTEAVINAGYSVGVGSKVVLKSEDKKIDGAATFLGNVIHSNGSESYRMYLNKTNKKIYYIDSSDFSRRNANLQTVVDPYEQAGGTCTAYAIFGYLQQKNLTGFEGTGELAKVLESEDTRTHLLADAIHEYYMTPAHRYSIRGILDKYGKKFGFKCKKFTTDTYEKARKHILDQLAVGSPVIVSFNIGPKMVNSEFELEMYGQTKPELDNRLWVPRKVGERNSGGHTIVAASAFELKGKTYMVMIDSDWSEPRFWDMESYLSGKTAIDEVEFISCK